MPLASAEKPASSRVLEMLVEPVCARDLIDVSESFGRARRSPNAKIRRSAPVPERHFDAR